MTPIRLAVNAKASLYSQAGIGRYIRELMPRIEAGGEFAPQYFFSTSWSDRLAYMPSLAGNPGLRQRVARWLPALRLLSRMHEQRQFAVGIHRGKFALYHEPDHLPFECGIPTLITVHDLSVLRFPETHPVERVRKFERQLPRAIERATLILTISEFSRREIVEVFGVAPERIVVTPLAAADVFRPRGEAECRYVLMPHSLEYRSYILIVGTVEPRKNLGLAFRAYRQLPEAIRARYPLVIAGGVGWRMEAFASEIEAMRVSGRVHWLGQVDDEALAGLYAGAAMLVYPSLYEGFGLPPLEAMSSAVPVVACNVSSIPEVVGDGGLLVEPGDDAALAEAMVRLTEDSRLAESIRQQGLSRAAGFSWSRCAELTTAAYRKVLAC